MITVSVKKLIYLYFHDFTVLFRKYVYRLFNFIFIINIIIIVIILLFPLA
jgi:hypothetical protein